MTSSNIISVMTANLRFGLADDGENSWNNRKNAYPELLYKYHPDFIQVQESNNFQTDFLWETLKEYSYIGKRDPSPTYWQNNIIFFKKSWTCIQEKHIFLSDTPDKESKWADSKWPRQCTLGLFERGSNRLLMINTHFDFLESVQEKSARLILKILSEFDPNIPVIITGDFNSHPGSPAHKIFTKNNFKDVFQDSHTSTYHGFTGKDKSDHIDWILFRGALDITAKKIIRNRFKGFYPSDHYPVFSTFKAV